MKKEAAAAVIPVRQRTQFSCMSTSMMMALKANGMETDEDTVNRVMGAMPLQGASWENAIACAQHYGMRVHLICPATLRQVKEFTDRGTPVMIAWNPEGREWSHASVIFDVDDDLTVSVADPNIPDPDQTVRIVPKDDFYHKWFEKWPHYLVRRTAMAIEREITPDGRQMVASSLSQPLSTRPDYGLQGDDEGMEKKATALNTLFLVHDPNSISTFNDITSALDMSSLPNYVIGTGANEWRQEHTMLHTDEAGARADAFGRIKKFWKGNIPDWVFENGMRIRASARPKSAYEVYVDENGRACDDDDNCWVSNGTTPGTYGLNEATRKGILRNAPYEYNRTGPVLSAKESLERQVAGRGILFGLLHDGKAAGREWVFIFENMGSGIPMTPKQADWFNGLYRRYQSFIRTIPKDILDDIKDGVSYNGMLVNPKWDGWSYAHFEGHPASSGKTFLTGPKKPGVRSAGYSGNPDGKDIYPVKIDHGYDMPISGGSDVMQHLVKNLRAEQGSPMASRVASRYLAGAVTKPEIWIDGEHIYVDPAFLKKVLADHAGEISKGQDNLWVHPDADDVPDNKAGEYYITFMREKDGWHKVMYNMHHKNLILDEAKRIRATEIHKPFTGDK